MPFPSSDDEINQVRAQLERVCRSEVFQSAKVLQRLLRHIVENTLAARPLTGITIAQDVFGGGDAAISRVRVEVFELRAKLDIYYSSAGAEDGIRIAVVKGSYIAKIDLTPSYDPSNANPQERNAIRDFLRDLDGSNKNIWDALYFGGDWSRFFRNAPPAVQVGTIQHGMLCFPPDFHGWLVAGLGASDGFSWPIPVFVTSIDPGVTRVYFWDHWIDFMVPLLSRGSGVVGLKALTIALQHGQRSHIHLSCWLCPNTSAVSLPKLRSPETNPPEPRRHASLWVAGYCLQSRIDDSSFPLSLSALK